MSDVWRQEAELLRTFHDECDMGDVYDGLRLRTSDDGVDAGDRTLSNCLKSAMSGDKKQSFYALLMMGLMWVIAFFATVSNGRSHFW